MSEQDSQLFKNLTDIEYIAANWLHHFLDDQVNGNLNDSTKHLVDQLFQAAEAKKDDWKVVWQLYDFISQQANENGTPEERGDVRIVCARIDLRYGRLNDAQRRLEEACSLYLPDLHHHTVATWMRAIPLWLREIPERRWEAFTIWEKIYRRFQDFSKNQTHIADNFLQDDNHEWYEARCQEIEEFLGEVREKLAATVQPMADGAQASQANQAVGQRMGKQEQPGEPKSAPENLRVQPAPGAPKKRGKPGYLRSYPIIPEPISAGDFRARIETAYNFPEYLYFKQVEINNELFDVISLMDGNLVKMTGAKSTYVLRVKGDSMNAYPILDGDYVMVCTGISPQTGQVVVTQILDNDVDDAFGMLKVLHSMDDKEIILEYRSHNPKYQDERGNNLLITLKRKGKQQPDIIGVAVARFTKASENPESG